MPIKKRNFTEEFREEAVRLALTSDQPHHDTALNLGVGKSTLSKWTRQYRHQIQPDKPSRDKDEELKRLRKENKILRAERDLLKKAAVDSMDEGNRLLYYPYETNLLGITNETKILIRRKRNMLEVMAKRVGV